MELLGEGQRAFDTRRWREIETVWCEPGGRGVKMYDTYGAQVAEFYVNQNNLAYERCYIFQIPESERNRNPNLTQINHTDNNYITDDGYENILEKYILNSFNDIVVKRMY